MTGKSGALYEKVFEEFFKLHIEEMDAVKKIYLRTDDEIAEYSGFERACQIFDIEVQHNLCSFHWGRLYRKKFSKLDPNLFEFDQNGKRCKNFKYYIFVKYLPLLSFQNTRITF